MKNYQKPEVEIVKFDTMESVMSGMPDIGGGAGKISGVGEDEE